MKAVRYHNGSQNMCALFAEPGRKWTQAIWVDHPIRIRKIRNAEAERYASELVGYTADRLARSMLAAGESLGITGGAEKLLTEALA